MVALHKVGLSPTRLICLISLLSVLSCKTPNQAPSSAEVKADQNAGSAREAFYETAKVQKVELWLPQWNELATQKPKGGRCNFLFQGEHYDEFQIPLLKVNGVEFKNVTAKKSSHCGSYSETKPNLKVKFGKAEKERAVQLLGVDNLILKNSVQDQSMIRQCLGAEIFAKAGFPKQFCNFVEVFANGNKIGLYVNLEPNDKTFFARTLGSAGNLYEVAGEELAPWAYERYKNNLDSFKDPEDESLSDMKALVNAFGRDQSSDLSDLKNYLDIDQFIRFWAMENIMVHWDGFANNINNAFIYFDPKDNKARMLPRGIDQCLTDYMNVREPKVPYTQMLFQRHSLPLKLTQNPQFRKQFQDAVRFYLNTIWNEEELLARVSALAAIVSPYVPDWNMNGETKWSYDRLRNVIRDRKKDMAIFIDNSPLAGASGGIATCSAGAPDTDRDGWGWENNQSCKISTGEAPICKSIAADEDGDGWGWENNQTCRVSAGGYIATCKNGSSDPDGDGWGWENNQTCKVPKGDTPVCRNGSATDQDGDGWGYEGGRSCKVR